MTEPRPVADLPQSRRWGAPGLVRLAVWGLVLRVAAADVVQWAASRRGGVCLFPDATYYWFLAGKIRRGEPYEVVDYGNLPRFSLRTPGYPLFLAACQWLFGPRVLPARLAQAALGAACVWLVARLVRRVWPEDDASGWGVPVVAAALTALDPFVVANSAFLLSEALFLPLMLLGQWAFAVLWTPAGERLSFRAAAGWGLLAGAAMGAAVLVRPSWLLYLPAVLGLLVFSAGRGRRLSAARGAAWAAVGFVAVMSPWWVRNAQVYGRFVPTALWMGASLYDGLSPRATGASDMSFLADPEFWPLGEEAQDAALRQAALTFADEYPERVAQLALIKAGRFWSPWPNADTFFSLPIALASAAVTVPIFGLAALGVWDRRRDARALALLGLPLLYTFLIHLVFVSSMRYRVPVFVPAFGLAAVGLRRVVRWRGGRPTAENAEGAEKEAGDG